MKAINISVEVVYATPEKQKIIFCEIPIGSTIADAIAISAILEEFPEIDLSTQKVGIWSKAKSLDDIVNNGDRIEIYRPLTIDPKEARRLRQKKKN